MSINVVAGRPLLFLFAVLPNDAILSLLPCAVASPRIPVIVSPDPNHFNCTTISYGSRMQLERRRESCAVANVYLLRDVRPHDLLFCVFFHYYKLAFYVNGLRQCGLILFRCILFLCRYLCQKIDSVKTNYPPVSLFLTGFLEENHHRWF